MNTYRKDEARRVREQAAQLAAERVHPIHKANEDEQKIRHTANSAKMHERPSIEGQASHLVGFTKGMPHHAETGLLIAPEYFQRFVRAIDSGDPRDFQDTPLAAEENVGLKRPSETFSIDLTTVWKSEKALKGDVVRDKFGEAVMDDNGKSTPGPVQPRAWESQSAGLAFDLEGPDAQAVTMPPAPALGSHELTAEMGEVYAQAYLRDVPFNAFSAGSDTASKRTALCMKPADFKKIKEALDGKGRKTGLNGLPWFQGVVDDACGEGCDRRRGPFSPGTAFRGLAFGDDVGPYISQFLLMGNEGLNSKETTKRKAAEGLIQYGAIRIDQRVRVAEQDDYMQYWNEWLDVQNGADLRNMELLNDAFHYRFIHTPRDLATYVHYDALYEAYLNACLLLLGRGTPFDPGIPFQGKDNRDHQQGFAHFGGPHILSLVTEVATRALKAVRFQKYNVHRRCRPEVLAARIDKAHVLMDLAPELDDMRTDLSDAGILQSINAMNPANPDNPGNKNYLLPMAFCEGSPMHPAYGAGHATVAGACVTILKAFFDHSRQLVADPASGDAGQAFVSVENGKKLKLVPVYDARGEAAKLTVEGELNKLAANISIGRDWAGVHYFTDYWNSLLMGEEIAIGILEEQKLTYGENFSMTVPLFDGGSRRI